MAEWIVEIVDGNPHIKKMIPLVRCKDCRWCKYLESVTSNYSLPVCGYKNAHGMLVNETGYCAWGERKEGADDGIL